MNQPTLGAAEQLLPLLTQNLPHRPGVQVRALEPLETGWETDLYRARIEFEGERGREIESLVIRLFHGQQHRQRARREFELMQRVQELGIPVPQMVELVAPNSASQWSLIVMEYLPGPNLRQRLAGQPDEQVLSALDQTAELLARIHRVPPSQALPEAAPETPEAMLRGLREATTLHQVAEFEPVLRWLEQPRPSEPAAAPTLLHNDYHPENLLVRSGELIAIDWSFARAGDYRLDLAWTVLLVGTMLGERFRQPMLESYARHRGGPVPAFEFFEALKLGARVLTLLTWLEGSVEIPVHRITPEAMRGDYKVHVLNPYRRLKQITGVELPSLEAL